jgi:hypothetical protein
MDSASELNTLIIKTDRRHMFLLVIYFFLFIQPTTHSSTVNLDDGPSSRWWNSNEKGDNVTRVSELA